MAKNFYAVLGVTGQASPEAIKAAYRRLVREYHPDHYGSDSSPFLAVQEAYSVLGDSGRRRNYDRSLDLIRRARPRSDLPETRGFGATPVTPLEPAGRVAPVEDVSLTRSFRSVSPSFVELFDRLWRNFTGLGVPKAERPEALTAEVTLSPEEAARGGQVRVGVPAHARCPTCGGRGGVGPYECWRCAGEGGITGEFPINISFRGGIRNEHEVLIPLDRFGIRNLYLTVRFRVSTHVDD